MKNSSDTIENRTPRPSGLQHSASTNWATVCPNVLYCTHAKLGIILKGEHRECVRKLLRLSHKRNERLEDKRNYRYRSFTACTSLDIIRKSNQIGDSEIGGERCTHRNNKHARKVLVAIPEEKRRLESCKIDALQDRKFTYNVTMRCVHVTVWGDSKYCIL